MLKTKIKLLGLLKTQVISIYSFALAKYYQAYESHIFNFFKLDFI